ncbi:MAG: dCTP deaminase [Thermoplasmata archaeon]|nr:dCTP deaminase [Thermoplasmata archaeon]
MCVLSDREIREYVKRKVLIIEPFVEQNLTPNGIDLCAHEVWIEGIPEKMVETAVSVPPVTRFMVSTRERVVMPEDLVGILWIKTSLARKGIFGAFGMIDAGFRGTLTLGFFNGSGEAVSLSQGAKIVQLVFVRMHSSPEKLYVERSGHYQDQQGITFSRV